MADFPWKQAKLKKGVAKMLTFRSPHQIHLSGIPQLVNYRQDTSVDQIEELAARSRRDDNSLALEGKAIAI